MNRLLLFAVFLISSASFGQQTYVPDNNFEAYLESNGWGNGVPNDDYVTTANITGVNAVIVWGLGISDLTGIEAFSSLSTLYCFNNNLTSLNLTGNPNLNDLRCNDNLITSLDVSNNTSLATFFCFNNQLTSLTGLSNTNVSDLRCSGNFLTTLDVTGLNGLTKLFCQTNQITALNVTQNALLNDLRCNNNQLTTLNVASNPNLSVLFCQYNSLTSINMSTNTALTYFSCFNNQLTSLNVSLNNGLINLQCGDNQLTTLDVSQNGALTTLLAANNELNCLVANNGLNLTLDISNNPSLGCASVTYPPHSYANATYDAGVSFQVQCGGPINNDVNQSGVVLTAQLNGASYQWLDCESNYAPIVGATFQDYAADSTGFYAVQLTYTDCFGTQVDTSTCHYIDCISGIDNDVTQNGLTLTAVMNNASYQWLDCDNNYAIIPGATNQVFNAPGVGHYAVRITFSNLCETVERDTSSCHLTEIPVGIDELNPNKAELVKIVDLLGRETPYVPNKVLIYIYSDGTIERVFKLER